MRDIQPQAIEFHDKCFMFARQKTRLAPVGARLAGEGVFKDAFAGKPGSYKSNPRIMNIIYRHKKTPRTSRGVFV